MLILILEFANNPSFMESISFHYSSNKNIMSGIHSLVSQIIIPFIIDFKYFVYSEGNITPSLIIPSNNKIFIVHGHDRSILHTLARFLEKLDLETIILEEKPNQGRTIIEKYEDHASEVSFAVVLLTPDDMVKSSSSEALEMRARQNVIFELGYFSGKLGRGRVCVMKKGDVDIPSDLFGVMYLNIAEGDSWKIDLIKELKAASIPVNTDLLWN